MKNNIYNEYSNSRELNNDINNSNYINFLDKKIEQIREKINSINVIDTLSEQVGLQYYKNINNIDDELYFEKAKNLNEEFYDNLDIKFNQIEEFLKNI